MESANQQILRLVLLVRPPETVMLDNIAIKERENASSSNRLDSYANQKPSALMDQFVILILLLVFKSVLLTFQFLMEPKSLVKTSLMTISHANLVTQSS